MSFFKKYFSMVVISTPVDEINCPPQDYDNDPWDIRLARDKGRLVPGEPDYVWENPFTDNGPSMYSEGIEANWPGV